MVPFGACFTSMLRVEQDIQLPAHPLCKYGSHGIISTEA